MARRARTRVALALILLVAVLAACSSGKSDPPAPSASIGQQADHALPASILTLPLIDSTGHPRQLESFAGKILVISTTMTLCQETCPLDTATIVQAARAVDKAGLSHKVEFASITVDPGRDTPTRLAAYRKLFKPAPANWVTLAGTPAAIGTLWNSLGVYRKKVANDSPPPATPSSAGGPPLPPTDWLTGKPLTYDIDHSDEVFFVDAKSTERFLLEGPPHVNSASAIPKTLYDFMDAQGHHDLTHPGAQTWTLPQALQVLSWLSGRRIGS